MSLIIMIITIVVAVVVVVALSPSSSSSLPLRSSLSPLSLSPSPSSSSPLSPLLYAVASYAAALVPLPQWERFAGFVKAGDPKEAWLSIR